MEYEMRPLTIKYLFHSGSTARVADINLHAFTRQPRRHVLRALSESLGEFDSLYRGLAP